MEPQEYNIPLDASIDVASIKMFTNVNAPKHLYNSQQYHNGVLQNSLRYEHNGYAAGKYVYEFNLIDGFTETIPERYVIHKYKLNNIPSYKLEFVGTDKHIIYNTKTALLVENNTNNISISTTDELTTLTGNFNNIPFSFTYNSVLNSVEEEMDRFDVDVIRNVNKTTTFNIKDMQNTLSVDIDSLVIGQAMVNDGYHLAYFESYIDDIYTWDYNVLTFKYNANTNQFTFTDNGQDVSTGSAILEHGDVTYSFNKNYELAVRLPLASETAAKYLFNVSEQRENVLHTTLSADMGANLLITDVAENDYLYASNNTDPTTNDTLEVGFNVPVWFQIDDRDCNETRDIRCNSIDEVYTNVINDNDATTLNIPIYVLDESAIMSTVTLPTKLSYNSVIADTAYPAYDYFITVLFSGSVKAVHIDKTAPKCVTRYNKEFYAFSYPEVAPSAPMYPYNIPFGTTPFVFDIVIKKPFVPPTTGFTEETYTICFCLKTHDTYEFTWLNRRPSNLLDAADNITLQTVTKVFSDAFVEYLPYMLTYEDGTTLNDSITAIDGTITVVDRTYEFIEYDGFFCKMPSYPEPGSPVDARYNFCFPCKRLNNWRMLYNANEAAVTNVSVCTKVTRDKARAQYSAEHIDSNLLLQHITLTPYLRDCFNNNYLRDVILNTDEEIVSIDEAKRLLRYDLVHLFDKIITLMSTIKSNLMCRSSVWKSLGLEENDSFLPLYTRIPQTVNDALNYNILPTSADYITTDKTKDRHIELCNIFSGIFSNIHVSFGEVNDNISTSSHLNIVGIYALEQRYSLQYKHEFFNSTFTNINSDFIVRDITKPFNNIFKAMYKVLDYSYLNGMSTLTLTIKEGPFYIHSMHDVVYTQLPIAEWIDDLYNSGKPEYLFEPRGSYFTKESSRDINTDIQDFVWTHNWYSCFALNKSSNDLELTPLKGMLQLVAPELTYFTAATQLPVKIDTLKIYNHHFKENVLPELAGKFSISVSDKTIMSALESTTVEQLVQYQTPDKTIDFKYTATVVIQQTNTDATWNLTENLVPVSDTLCTVDNYEFNVTPLYTKVDTDKTAKWSETPSLTMSVDLTYNLRSTLPTITDSRYTLVSFVDNVYTINATEGYTLKYNSATGTVSGTTKNGINFITSDIKLINLSDNTYHIVFDYVYTLPVTCTIEGPFTANVQLKEYKSHDYFVFTQDYKDYKIDLKDLFNSLNETQLQVTSTDVTTQKTQVLKTIDCDTLSQIIKQQWDSSAETDYFWWIDASHIAKLDGTQLRVLLKQNTLDDWAGDEWQEIHSYLRDQLIPDTVKHYDMTCAKDSTALFYTLSIADIYTLKIKVYDLLSDTLFKEYDIQISTRKIGELLNSSNQYINTYSYMTVDMLLTSAKFSATRIGKFMLLGIHQDKNFNQWTICINLETDQYYILQGYGFVGLDGTLTGGEIPEDYFNIQKGFNTYVTDVNILKNNDDIEAKLDKSDISSLAELYELDDQVIGTDKQQWYITKKIKGIISHCVFNKYTGMFTPVTIPLTNNYDVTYASASFLKYLQGDSKPSWEAVANLLNDVLKGNEAALKIWQTIWKIGTYPFVLLMKPRISYINYLQQTLGQYAYVHRNSTKYKPDVFYKPTTQREVGDVSKDAELSVKQTLVVGEDELSFAMQTITQETNPDDLDIKLPVFFKLAMIQVAMELIKSVPAGINEIVNNGSVDNTLRTMGQNFAVNALNVLSMNNNIQSLTPALKSRVTALKTLDMFYSTSSLQNVHAGPGYVNHNFVAQCVAQSTTSTQIELSQMQLYYLVKEFALWQIDLVIFAADKVVEGLDALSGVPTGGDISYVAAVAAYIAIKVARTVAVVYQEFMKALREIAPTILNGLGGDRLRANLVAGKSHHDYNIEGKHTYGNKTEVFMWPCKVPVTNKVTDEYVDAVLKEQTWSIDLATSDNNDITVLASMKPNFVTHTVLERTQKTWKGDIPMYIVGCRGFGKEEVLPEDMACVIGTHSFLSPQWFKNENINESEPVFATPVIQDYVIDELWGIYRTATAGETIWLSCDDTKIIDGDYTNIVISDSFCGIASTYCALEIKKGITEKYIRPFNLTTNVLGLNNTGFNTIYDDTVYHGFDGQGYRIVSWIGNSGMNKEFQTLQYNYVANDRFKRSNKLPPNQFLGNFKTDPLCIITALGEDTVDTIITQPSENTGVEVGTAGEDKDALRYALPVCIEPVSYLPAVVKTLSSYELAVVDGVTSLCTDIRNTQNKYKTNISIDFTLNGQLYRYCDEYICTVKNKNGVVIVDKVVPCIGLKYLGASPYEAYFYNTDTRQLFMYTGDNNLQVINMLERFRDIKQSAYNFIDQTVAVITVDDEPLVLNSKLFTHNIAKPLRTLYNDKSGYKVLSVATGLVYQGPNRCSINRYIYNDYMHDNIRDNLGKWKKVPRNEYTMYPSRVYDVLFENVTIAPESSIFGWTHNPFILQTAPLGLSEQVDALFEWTITFAWTDTLERVYKQDEYACVNICAISYAPGAQLMSDVTHVYLTRELFGRANVGYYSFKFISNNGACNRESLCIWSDSLIAVSELTVTVKPVTGKRTEILTQQTDVQDYEEF